MPTGFEFENRRGAKQYLKMESNLSSIKGTKMQQDQMMMMINSVNQFSRPDNRSKTPRSLNTTLRLGPNFYGTIGSAVSGGDL